MVHFPLAMLGCRHHGLYIVHGPLSVGHTWSSIPWTIFHAPSSVDHTWHDTINNYYSSWSTFHWPYSVDDTMDRIIIHGPLSVGHTPCRYYGLVHGPLSVDHTRVLIPWTIVHVPLSIGHTRRSIPWTIVHDPLSVGNSRQ